MNSMKSFMNDPAFGVSFEVRADFGRFAAQNEVRETFFAGSLGKFPNPAVLPEIPCCQSRIPTWWKVGDVS